MQTDRTSIVFITGRFVVCFVLDLLQPARLDRSWDVGIFTRVRTRIRLRICPTGRVFLVIRGHNSAITIGRTRKGDALGLKRLLNLRQLFDERRELRNVERNALYIELALHNFGCYDSLRSEDSPSLQATFRRSFRRTLEYQRAFCP